MNITRHKNLSQDCRRIYVHVRHEPSQCYGISSRPIGDLPICILQNMADEDFSDPLLLEMEAEAISEMLDHARNAQELLAPKVAA
jgi:hypothetical protein